MSDDAIVERPTMGGSANVEPPATFRNIFAVREYRNLWFATALSALGDYVAKAAIMVLVFQQTKSVALSAAAFAISYLPWIVGGPFLAALAERYPYRTVMIVCDVVRMVLIAAVAMPGVPVPALLALLFVAMLANPPTQAARSALLPQLLSRNQLIGGIAVNTSTAQAAQVVGYLVGATASSLFDPRLSLAFDAFTFAVSALLLTVGLKPRPPAFSADDRTHLLDETAAGFRLVFGLTLFAIVPEGLAAAWAKTLADGDAEGITQAMIMAAGPTGFILGGLVVGRFAGSDLRRRLIRPFAVLAPLALVPALVGPPAPVVALMALVSGFAVAGLLPVLNGIFVLALPHGFRARAFGVMQGGIQLTQGGAVLVTGLLAERFNLPTVVGVWSIAGVLLMLVIISRWPSANRFDAAITAAAERNGATEGLRQHTGPDGPPTGEPQPAAPRGAGRATPPVENGITPADVTVSPEHSALPSQSAAGRHIPAPGTSDRRAAPPGIRRPPGQTSGSVSSDSHRASA